MILIHANVKVLSLILRCIKWFWFVHHRFPLREYRAIKSYYLRSKLSVEALVNFDLDMDVSRRVSVCSSHILKKKTATINLK
jgi:hypothetical protein